MKSEERILIAYNALSGVYREGAYSSIILNKTLEGVTDAADRAYITRLFYGVLSKDIQLNYILKRLVEKNPKPVVRVVLKMGLYMLRYMNIPSYAVINTQVELVKKIGKRELSGFVNAVLRRSDGVTLPVNTGNFALDCSVNYSCPEWLVKRLIADYGKAFTGEFLSYKADERTHIRLNSAKISQSEWETLVPSAQKTDCGYYIVHEDIKSILPSLYTVQSRASVLACKEYCRGESEGIAVLDLCAAPGGKSVFVAGELNAKVTACDIHEHRVSLIKSYADRMGVRLTALVNDATVFNPAFEGGFDMVICDAPCSGIGVIHSKPDILLNRKESDISSLAQIQREILQTASKYLKKGGALCYSTCTVIKAENEAIVDEFLKNNPSFKLESTLNLFPQTDGCDGFFVAKMRRCAND